MEILLKPTGSAPIINKNKWSLGAEKRVSYILYWLHSYFKLDAEEKIVSDRWIFGGPIDFDQSIKQICVSQIQIKKQLNNLFYCSLYM